MAKAIKWHSVFGGIPKYYVVAEEQGIKKKDILATLKILLFRDFAPLRDEVKIVLIEELEKSIVFIFQF